MGQVREASWYDYPQYYDLAFRDETAAEVRFIEAAGRKYCPFPVRRIVEPGCGSGRLVAALAARGYRVTAFDLNEKSLDYVRRRLQRRGLQAEVFRADMADFRIRHRADVVVNTWNTFRHMLSESQARGHLQSVARSLRVGGILILGLHILPLDVSEESVERWTARHGRVRLSVTLRVTRFDRRRRVEWLCANMRVRGGATQMRLQSSFPFRLYTPAQFRRLLGSVPQLRLCDVYDFWYDIDRPLQWSDRMTDTVFILQRRADREWGGSGDSEALA